MAKSLSEGVEGFPKDKACRKFTSVEHPCNMPRITKVGFNSLPWVLHSFESCCVSKIKPLYFSLKKEPELSVEANGLKGTEDRFMPFLNKLNYFLSCFRSYSTYFKFFTVLVKDTVCKRILVKVNTYKNLVHGFSPFCSTGERLRFSLTHPDACRGNRALCPGGVLCLV